MIVFPFSFMAGTGSGPAPGPTTIENYYSVDFDGTNDYVDLGTELNSMFELGDSFSISAWIKFGNTATDRTIVANLNSGTKGFQLRLRPTEQVRWAIAQTPTVYGVVDTSVLAIDTWHHIVATYDGTNVTGLKLYVNGSLDTGTLDSAGTILDITNTESIKIGKYASGQFYAGNIDEVAIFDSELSASDVTSIYNGGTPASLSGETSLQGWWRMGDGANYPIIKNQKRFSQTATDYDGTNDYVVTNISALNNLADCTISFWFKLDATSDRMMVGDFIDGSNGIWLYWDGTTWYFSPRNASGVVSTTYTWTGKDTNWHHIVGVKSGTGGTIYIDGTSVATGTASATLTSATGDNFQLGALTAASLYANGKIDDVSIYNSALGSSDITDIYNSGYPKDESERSGLVAYYKFDGDTYPVVRDALQFSNASLRFDGVIELVDIGRVTEIDGASSFSICGWYNQNTIDQQRHMWGTYNTSTNAYTAQTYVDGNLYIELRNSVVTYGYFDYSTVVTAGEWFHFAVIFDGSGATNADRMKVYVDGSEVTLTYSGTIPSTLPTTGNDFYIGAWGGTTTIEWFGEISNFLMTTSALSASDITDIYNSGKPKDESSRSNIVGYWRMGDNTIFPNVPSALGYGTHSVDFDGTDDYVTMGDVSSLDFSNSDAFSISAWVKLATVSSTHKMIVSKMDETTDYRGYNIRSYNGAVKVSLSNDAGTNELQYTSTANPLTAGTWHHVVFTYDGSSASSGCTVYVDGSAEAGSWTGTLSATISNSAPFNIGARNNGSLPFNGKIKQVAVFDTELSSSDVTALYNSGLPKDISSESGLVSYYRMGDGEDKYPNILDYKGTNHGTMTNMASDDITTANVGSVLMTNMASDNIVADTPAGTSGQMTNMASDDFVAAKDAGTMTNMDAEDIVAETP